MGAFRLALPVRAAVLVCVAAQWILPFPARCQDEVLEEPSGTLAQGCRLEDPQRCLEIGKAAEKEGDHISAFEAFSVACAASEREGCRRMGPLAGRLTGRGWLIGKIEGIRSFTFTLGVGGEAKPQNAEVEVSRLWVDNSRVRELQCEGFEGDYEVSEQTFELKLVDSTEASSEFRYAVIRGWVPLVDGEPCLLSEGTRVRLLSSEAATLFGASSAGAFRINARGDLKPIIRVGGVDLLRRDLAAAGGVVVLVLILMVVLISRRRRAAKVTRAQP